MRYLIFSLLFATSLIASDDSQNIEISEIAGNDAVASNQSSMDWTATSLKAAMTNDLFLPVFKQSYKNPLLPTSASSPSSPKVANDIATNQQSSIDLTTNPLKTTITSNDLSSKPPILEQSYKSPLLAASLSLIPGLGHAYLGDMKTAGALAANAALGIGVAASAQDNENLLVPSVVYCSTSLYYGIYAAYRDARTLNGASRYSYKMPVDQFADLSYAPFQLSILKKPEVWGGVLGFLSLGAAVVYFGYPEKAKVKIEASVANVMPALSLPVALGEESLFRGFLQSAISENSTPWAGLALSSLAFGAAHIPNARFLEPEERQRYYTLSLPLITALGAYCGWLTQKNHSLKESVALHMWYDLIIFSTAALASHKASMGPTSFSMSIPF